MGLFGALLVVAIAVAAGYYAYKGVMGVDETPTCNSTFTACMQSCRRTSTEAPAAQACQEGCKRDAEACKRRGR